MKLKLLLLVLLILLGNSCTLTKVLKTINHDPINTTNYLHTIPFVNQDKMVIVKVSIYGEVYDFIFDTGAFNVISEQIADSLGLPRFKGPRVLDSQGNKKNIDFTVPDSICLGSLLLSKPGCGIYNFNDNQEFGCFPFQGILGANVFSNAVCQINFKTNTLVVTDNIKKLSIPENAVSFKFRKHITGQPLISIKAEGVKVRNVILDYGSGSGINISSQRLIKKIERQQLRHVIFEGTNAIGLFGKKDARVCYYKPRELTIEKLGLKDQTVMIENKGISTLGMSFLENYMITLDFKNSIVYFVPEPLRATEELSVFGLVPSLSEGKLVVSGLFIPSPAYEAGIQKGDEIISVDGREYTDMNNSQYCEILKKGIFDKDRDTTEITLKSSGKTRMVSLIKRELLK